MRSTWSVISLAPRRRDLRPRFRSLEIAFVNLGQRLALDRRIERAETLVDRQKLDNRRPGVDEILEGRADLLEGVEDLVHRAEGDLARDDSGRKDDVGEDVVRLQVKNPGNVEVHVVEVEAKVIEPHI